MRLFPTTVTMVLAGESGTTLQTAPDFTLFSPATGAAVSLASVRGAAATVILFVCEHCPFVVSVRGAIQALAADYARRGVRVVLICPNADYPGDGPAAIKAASAAFYPAAAAYLVDDTQRVARAYGAVCTPDCYIFDAALRAVYRGRIDASTPGNGVTPDGGYIRAALDALLAGASVPAAPKSMGCSIKWKDE